MADVSKRHRRYAADGTWDRVLVYHHLKELTAAGWLVSPRRGLFDMPPSRVVPLLAILVAAGTPAARPQRLRARAAELGRPAATEQDSVRSARPPIGL